MLHQHVVRINCEQFLEMHCMCTHPCSRSLSQPSSGVHNVFARREINSRMTSIASMSLHHGSLSYLNSSLAVTLVLLTVPHLFCVSSGGGQSGKGQLIPPLALSEMQNPATGFSCKPSRLLWIKLLNQSRQIIPCCFIEVNTSSLLPFQQLRD